MGTDAQIRLESWFKEKEKRVTESMIERVGKALIAEAEMYESFGDNGGYEYPTVEDIADCLARAAIAAMREPTEAMLRPDGQDFQMRYFDLHRKDDTAGIWRAMIDAALAEDQGGGTTTATG